MLRKKQELVNVLLYCRIEAQHSFLQLRSNPKVHGDAKEGIELAIEPINYIALPHPTPPPYRGELTPLPLTPCNGARIEAPVNHAYIECFKRHLRVKASEH